MIVVVELKHEPLHVRCAIAACRCAGVGPFDQTEADCLAVKAEPYAGVAVGEFVPSVDGSSYEGIQDPDGPVDCLAGDVHSEVTAAGQPVIVSVSAPMLPQRSGSSIDNRMEG